MGEKITTSVPRKIIDDFANEIKEKATKGSSPEKAVIEFRDDRKRGKSGERDVFFVPISLLKFRKDNGRIASDIASYEKLHGNLNEDEQETQEIIKKFLQKKDEENNLKLRKSIEHSGQNEPAIITCDGFLINGNRRKMTFEVLLETTKDRQYERMKVVILPGIGDEGGPPTIKEIEEIENRYQLQSDGKSEYTNFDRAISIKRKINAGMSLEEQLKDDPSLVGLSHKEFKKELQKYQDQFLGPLDCIDRYLDQLDRSELYDNISEGRNDREGRWYSFIDYYGFHKQLRNDDGELTKRAMDLGIEDDETGDIENIAFKIIRKKDFPYNKTHEVIRKLPKILGNNEAKKEIMKIKNISDLLPKEEYNEEDEFNIIDKKWGKKNETFIVGKVNTALKIIEYEKDRETPLTLLEDALKKLNHDNMDPEAVLLDKITEAMKLAREVAKRANDLEHEFYHIEKESKSKLKGINKNK
ncbi:MAG: hypothetical protein WCK67_12870 [bacterium]